MRHSDINVRTVRSAGWGSREGVRGAGRGVLVHSPATAGQLATPLELKHSTKLPLSNEHLFLMDSFLKALLT